MNLIEYPDVEFMMMKLADILAGELEQALLTHDAVSFAVAGGTTPAPVYDTLSAIHLDWKRITVLPTDERCVPPDHDRSNARLIVNRLMTGAASGARFQPLYPGGPVDKVPGALAPVLKALSPISVMLLGMGDDMHVASLFPGAQGLSQALSHKAGPVAVIRPPGQPEARISLSAPMLTGALSVHLLIRGAAKRAALERARSLPPEEAPVRLILDTATIHWSE